MAHTVGIYTGSAELPPHAKTALLDGIDHLAATCGVGLEPKIATHCPKLNSSNIDPGELQIEELSADITLALLVGDFALRGSKAGASYFGSGFAFLNTAGIFRDRGSRAEAALTRVTTTHELAHALGFVRPAVQSEGHCSQPNCIMQGSVKNMYVPRQLGLGSIWQEVVPILDNRPEEVNYDTAFCGSCQDDMFEYSAPLLGNVKQSRKDAQTHA